MCEDLRAPFAWRSFLDLARRLATEVEDEDALRTSISRSYYAVFAIARDRLRADGCWKAGVDPHTRVWAMYRNASSERCRRIGEKGFNLRDRRRRADYDAVLQGAVERHAEFAVSIGQHILELFDDLDDEETCCA